MISPWRSPASAPKSTSAQRSGSTFTASVSRDSSSKVRKSNFCTGTFFSKASPVARFRGARLGEQARLQDFDQMHPDGIEWQVAEHREQVRLQDARLTTPT